MGIVGKRAYHFAILHKVSSSSSSSSSSSTYWYETYLHVYNHNNNIITSYNMITNDK